MLYSKRKKIAEVAYKWLEWNSTETFNIEDILNAVTALFELGWLREEKKPTISELEEKSQLGIQRLDSKYEPEDWEDMAETLAEFLRPYANAKNWRPSRGHPPHHLREGVYLDFHPSNVVHGFRFAQEALAALERFKLRRTNVTDSVGNPIQRETSNYYKGPVSANPPIAKCHESFSVGDIIRMPHYPTVGRGVYRVWQVVGVHLGGENQEGTYELRPLDILANGTIQVPCIMLEYHPLIEKVL